MTKKKIASSSRGGAKQKRRAAPKHPKSRAPIPAADSGAQIAGTERKQKKNAAALTEKKRRRHRPRKRIPLSEAMRRAGIDEHFIAENYFGVADKLTKNENGDSVEKLLVDVLKEFTRVLDPPKTASARLTA